MKKIVILFAVLALLMLASCNKPADVTAPSDDELQGEDERFYNTVEEVVDCYFSLLTEDGFGNYIMAFPQEFVKGYKKDIGFENDEEKFNEAVDNATYSLHVNRDQRFDGAEYHIEYEFEKEVEMTDSEKEILIKDLVDYCHMTRSTIEKVALYEYKVVEYGVDEEGYVVNEEEYTEELNMLYITGEGWYVSPNEFELP